MSNRPRSYYRVGGSVRSGRSRKFSLITYLDKGFLDVILLKHQEQVRVYAYAYHDKDKREDGTLKEPHIHLVLVTYNAHTCSSIRRWFSGIHDDKGLEITTTCQICSDVFEMYDYLTHSTVQSRLDGKYPYDKSIICTNDVQGVSSYFRGDDCADYDSITLACEELLKGAKIRDLGKRYGRDFILHYNTIKQYVSDVRSCQKYDQSFEELLDHEYELELRKISNDNLI